MPPAPEIIREAILDLQRTMVDPKAHAVTAQNERLARYRASSSPQLWRRPGRLPCGGSVMPIML